jgi:NTE family protein
MIAQWQTMRTLRDSAAFKANTNPAIAALLRTPNIDLYAVDVSFSRLKDDAEREYLNNLPTSFVLPAEAVDRLRAAAGKISLESPDFQKVLKDTGATIIVEPSTEQPAAVPIAH